MSETVFPWNRLATIVELAARSPAGLGRTALMKYTYFLQVVRGVPLGYDFSLYSYGPFDPKVLDDLEYAQTLKAAEVTPVYYPGGYGYSIRPGAAAESFRTRAREFLDRYAGDIDWVLREFGGLSAAQLELASTMVLVDREALQSTEALSLAELVHRVREVKPRFTDPQVLAQAESLQEKGLLHAAPG
jgi:hypothetical protein